jgi:hypothetical protein
MKGQFVFAATLAAAVVLGVSSALARESWPVAPAAEQERQREFTAYGQEVASTADNGIPLCCKKKYHLDTNDVALAQKDLQGDGYTVMDKYLDGLDPNKKIDWSDPGSNVNTLK